MYCSKCGKKCSSEDKFCAYCGNALPVGEGYQVEGMVSSSSGVSLDEELLEVYIGNHYDQIVSGKFSFWALFLSSPYLLYRKLYVYGMGLMVIANLLQLMFGEMGDYIIFVLLIILGIYFNKCYVSYAKKQVEKIKNENSMADTETLKSLCQNAGGTSIVKGLLIYFGFSLLISFIIELFF